MAEEHKKQTQAYLLRSGRSGQDDLQVFAGLRNEDVDNHALGAVEQTTEHINTHEKKKERSKG